MTVTRLSQEHQGIYSLFVAAHMSGSFLQSWTWGDFQTQSGKQAIRYGVFEDNYLVATVQLLQTKIPMLPGTYVYAPYGPLVKEADSDKATEIISNLFAKLKADFAKSWFVRVEPKDDLPLDGKPVLHIQPASTLVTDISVSEEELLAGMHTKTRYNIKVAAKHDVTVTMEERYDQEAIELLSKTSHRQGYKSHSPAYYKQLLNFLGSKDQSADHDCTAHLYKAVQEGKCIASAIMIDSGTTRTYLFGGSDNEHRNLMAPYAMHWQAIRDAKATGFTSYDWWGTETATGATPGFVQFKLRWGGTQRFYAEARDIVLNSTWYRAYTALRKINRLK